MNKNKTSKYNVKVKTIKYNESFRKTISSDSHLFPLLLNVIFSLLKEEDPKNTMDKERRKSLIKPKLLRLQKDIEKASRDKEGV